MVRLCGREMGNNGENGNVGRMGTYATRECCLHSYFGDCLKRIWELTEVFFGIQLVAEGSLSFKRGLGEVQTRARLNDNEGSVFQ